MAGSHTEAVLNKLSKQELVQFLSMQRLIWVRKFLLWEMKSRVS